MNALVIIDMQEAYFADDRLKKQQNELVRNVEEQIAIHLRNGDAIINVTTVHTPDKQTWTLNMLEDDQGFLLQNSDETKTIVTLPPSTIGVLKTRDSAFHDTNLLDVLRKNDINHITLVGVSAHTCIFHTAAAAYAYNIRVELVRNAIGDEDESAKDAALSYLAKEYRQTIS